MEVQWAIARHTPREYMMKPMVLHSNWHLHAVTPAKEGQWRVWNNVNFVLCMQPQNASARRLFMKLI